MQSTERKKRKSKNWRKFNIKFRLKLRLSCKSCRIKSFGLDKFEFLIIHPFFYFCAFSYNSLSQNHLSMNLKFDNQKVIIRVDFNVPLDADYNITDDTRIQAALPTILHVLEEGSAVILMSHLGRPQKKRKKDGSIDVERFTLRHIVPHLTKLLGVEVQFADNTVGETTQALADQLTKGEVLLLENTRFEKGEAKGDEALAKQLANLADIYINDAFGTAHRAHASTTTIAQYFDEAHKCFGFLMKKRNRKCQ